MAWLRREDLEDRELRTLGPWAAQSKHHGGRRIDEPDDEIRTAFQRDRDRIIHCASFRRLQHKTQVQPAFSGDHFRSRMTHSIEVSQMARGVAIALRLNPDLAEAIALGHDLGHPPFGHAGEDMLDDLMAGHGGFRHNAQSSRTVDYLEDRYGQGCGLNLVRATRISFLKGKIPDGYPLSEDLLPKQAPPIEARVVDQCDKIAYMCHDLDDGLRSGAFSLQEAGALELWKAACQSAGRDQTNRVISEITALLILDIVESNAEAFASEEEPQPSIQNGQEMRAMSKELLIFLRDRFYLSDSVLTKMNLGRDKIRSVFEHLVAHPEDLPDNVRERIAEDTLHRTICDYVAGMTDRFLLAQ